MQTKVEVMLCSSCEGKGYIWGSDLIDYHKREYEAYKVTCKPCGGSGRMVKKTTITYEKFVDEVRS
jgi:DnaJ-class molecular chaperone